MPGSTQFNELYQKLNSAQKTAVDTIEGPVMVIAGPGTGKTQILTLRIANILLQTQINPDNILALTFTDSAALAMRKRLAEIIGTGAYRTEITTFHTFCNEIIRKNPEEFPHLISANSITEIEQIQIIEKIIKESSLTLLKPFGDPLYYVKPAIGAINDLKKEGVSVEKLKQGLKEQQADFDQTQDLYHDKGAFKGQMKGKYAQLQKDLAKTEELLLVYDQYQKQLQLQKLYDFNDMLMEVVAAFENNQKLLLRVQEIYQYLLVDEHQDTNFAQNRLIELLCNFHPNPNLFVVGDEKQAIYRFQGASLENFLYFKKLYPEAVLINLENNYRSTQTILNAAGSLIKNNITSDLLPQRVELKTQNKYPEEKIKIAGLSDFFGEYYFVSQKIKELLKQGVTPKEIGVLCRNNRDLAPLVEVFEQVGVAYVIEADQDIFADPQIHKFILLLKAIDRFGSEQEMVAALHADFLQIEPLDLYKLINFSVRKKISTGEILASLTLTGEIGLTNASKLTDFYIKLKNWKILSQNDSLATLFVSVLNESGLLDHILEKRNALEIIDKLTAIFEDIKTHLGRNSQFNLTDFLNYLNLLEEHGLLIKRPVKTTLKDTVRLMTAHKSKGLEFEYVFIINAFDGHWGNLRRRGSSIKIPWEYLGVKLKLGVEIEENEDERRLFYVSLTRAKKQVFISYSSKSLEGKQQLPSQFIDEIDLKYRQNLDTTGFDDNFLAHKELIFSPKKVVASELKDKQFFQELFLERGLSVTGLNNFLTCPWRFFYRNLLQLPDVKEKPAMFGSAIHKALSTYIKALATKSATNLVLLESYFESLANQPLNTQDFEELTKKGELVLNSYFEQRIKSWTTSPKLSELYIKGVRLTETIVLNGIIDMIDRTGPFNEVVVYDFKTGKPKSRHEIEGLTTSSEGNYKRQLVFYKLLMDRFFDGKMKMKSGVIEFIEPDAKGKYHFEEFTIKDTEIEELEQLIKGVAEQIINLSFWDFRCGDKDCRYCRMRQLMQPLGGVAII